MVFILTVNLVRLVFLFMSGALACSSSGEDIINGSANQRKRQVSWISNCFKYFLRTSREKFLAILMILHVVVLDNVENATANQRSGQSSLISNSYQKWKHFLRGTFLANLLMSHAVFLEKKPKKKCLCQSEPWRPSWILSGLKK